MNSKTPERIPIILLNGFLGSGKTTLLNSLLKKWPRSAVIINEFGATPIDQELLREHNILLSVLAGGCLCCQVRDTLIPVLKNLRMAWENSKTGPSCDGLSSKPFDRIIIETSGVANPLAVLDVLLNQRWLSTRISLKAVITTVSALMAQDHFDSFPEITAQIAWADTIVITQTDLASNEQIEHLHARLDSLAPAAPRFQAANGLIDVDSVFETPVPFHRLDIHTAIEIPDHHFYSLDLRLEHPIPWEKLKTALLTLMAQHSGQLLRLKGMTYTPDDNNPLLVQGVAGQLYPPIHLPARSSDDGIGHLIIISHGEIKNLAQDLISKLNELC